MRRRTLAALIAASAIGAPLATAAPSLGDGSSLSVGVNITPSVTSVTVSTASINTNTCFTADGNTDAYDTWLAAEDNGGNPASSGTTLGFPNGWCTSPAFTVTNGNAPSDIDVSSGNAAPGAGTTGGWTLVQATAPLQDQYDLDVYGQFGATTQVYGTAASAACDTAFDIGDANSPNESGCTAAPGDISTQYIGIDGPSAQATGDTATEESGQLTFTAVSP